MKCIEFALFGVDIDDTARHRYEHFHDYTSERSSLAVKNSRRCQTTVTKLLGSPRVRSKFVVIP